MDQSTKNKKILMLTHKPETRPGHLNWIALRDLVRQEMPDEVTVEMSALSELTYIVGSEECRIYDRKQGYDVADFDLVVIRTMSGELDAAICVAAYCRKKGIPYIDKYMSHIGNTKISCAFTRWEKDMPVPVTAYGSAANIEAVAAEGTLGWPLIVKADNGKKGDDNHLARTIEEVRQILADADKRFVLQSFIPNDGDYRILVYNDKPRLAILRKAASGSHLNNTSKGGQAVNVPLDELAPEVKEFAVKAALLEKLALAGVDIVIDKNTGKPYILEVNRAPQIATGAFAETKLKYYTEMLKELVAGSGARSD